MGASNTYIASGYGLQAAGSLVAGYSEAEALKAQGAYQKSQAENNAKLIELQAEDAINRGELEANQAKKAGKAAVASNRASAAAQGIDADYGSAALLSIDAEEQTLKDIMTIRNNAWRESWGFKTQAASVRGQGRMAEMAAKTKAGNTLLTGGLQAIGYGAQGIGTYIGKTAAKETAATSDVDVSYTKRDEPAWFYGMTPRKQPFRSSGVA